MNPNKIHEWINTGLIVLVAILVLVGGNQSGLFGATGTRFPYGISADSTSPSAGEVRGSTLTITGAQTLTGASALSSTLGVAATTTLADGLQLTNPGICIEIYATSTATKGHMVASTTATIEGVDGVMMFAYGACDY